MKHGDYEYKNITGKDIKDIDKSVLEDYLHARRELSELKKRTKILQSFVDKNAETCEKYLWTNQLGQTVSILDIDDTYLVNLTKFLARSPRWAYEDGIQEKLEALAGELDRRKITIEGVELLESGR